MRGLLRGWTAGRALVALDLLSFWPMWLAAAALGRFLERSGRVAHGCIIRDPPPIAVAFFLALGLVATYTWARSHEGELVASSPRGWSFGVSVAIAAMLIGVRLPPAATPIFVGCAAMAGLAGAWHLALGHDARGWITGVLRTGGEPRVETERIRFVLAAIPRGCGDGDVITLPRVRIDGGVGGPYRTGTARAWAPEIWLVDGRALARRLRNRGLALLAWASVTLIWVALR